MLFSSQQVANKAGSSFPEAAVAAVVETEAEALSPRQAPKEILVGDIMTSTENKRRPTAGYDIVTMIHHNDMGVFIDHGLRSWLQYFAYDESTLIYAVATPQAIEKLSILRLRDPATHPISKDLERVVLVPESIYPFTLQDVGNHTWADKATWIYQQLLKLYAAQVLETVHPQVKPLFLVMDSDTVAIRPYKFLHHDGRPIYNIASMSSGAFDIDCQIGRKLVQEVFGNVNGVPKAFVDAGKEKFTAIAHYMVIHGAVVQEMLDTISHVHGAGATPTWQILGKLNSSVLSEWELYMAWMMKHHRQDIILQQLPYVNWGTLTTENLALLRKHRDVVYLTRHDDYRPNTMCCVNSDWVGHIVDNSGLRSCECCTYGPCKPLRITCEVLQIEGCRQDINGTLSFQVVA
jgi:Family of unknown function (DUF6492)